MVVWLICTWCLLFAAICVLIGTTFRRPELHREHWFRVSEIVWGLSVLLYLAVLAGVVLVAIVLHFGDFWYGWKLCLLLGGAVFPLDVAGHVLDGVKKGIHHGK